jgi:tetratricopeptide (TPR) repeat protein/tRNA A-37 threonylcarbamoyl transferase component Bud32/TolB-like protein
MKTFSPGLSDSIASVIADPRPCPHCDSSSNIAGGLCVGCLLEAGLDPADEGESESLTGILAEVNLPDQNWRLGNYEILEEIGRGGMGVIYRARQRHSRRIVAVKRVLSYHSDSRETLARFRREAQAAASLDHPNILPIFEVSESEDGLPFFSMKFAPGGTLQQVAPALRNEPRQCVAFVAKIARAVQYAHSRGILHRDLKPGNILLDARGEPLVSDFGLAKWLDTTSDLTRTLTIFGTPGYIAPEQASNSAADLKPTADIYSLGAILFDLLAGRPPFLGAHALSVIRQAAESPAPKLRTLSKVADRDLETICSRCLEREPSARYHSAHDLAEDLERWLEGRPIIARPVSPPIRLWRWSKRNRRAAVLIASVVAVGAAALVWRLQNRVLSQEVRDQQVAARSMVVLPFLDLDTAQADEALTAEIAAILAQQINSVAPSSVQLAKKEPAGWLGIGSEEEVRATAREYHAATVLAGTTRIVAGRRRIALKLVRENGSDVAATHIVEYGDRRELGLAFGRQGVAKLLSVGLDGRNDGSSLTEAVPLAAMARSYLQTGRDLLDRRTRTDIERAITCFENAIAASPKSPEGYSYLALAYMGRNFIVDDPSNLQQALAAAQAALVLAPHDGMAHRSLAAVYIALAQYDKALEHSFQSIEAPQVTEKAFGQIGFTWRTIGRPDKAIPWFEKAKATQRLPADYDVLVGDCWSLLGDDARADAAYEVAAKFRPDLPDGWVGRCHLRVAQGRLEEARQLYREHAAEYGTYQNAKQIEAEIELFGKNFTGAEQLYLALQAENPIGGGFHQYASIGYASALARLARDRQDSAYAQLIQQCRAADQLALTKKPKDPDVLYGAAATKAISGEKDSALQLLAQAIDAGWTDWRSTSLDPRFDDLRELPAFNAILQHLHEEMERLRLGSAPFLTKR